MRHLLFLLHHKSRKLFPISSESISSFSVYSRGVFLRVTVSRFIEPVPEWEAVEVSPVVCCSSRFVRALFYGSVFQQPFSEMGSFVYWGERSVQPLETAMGDGNSSQRLRVQTTQPWAATCDKIVPANTVQLELHVCVHVRMCVSFILFIFLFLCLCFCRVVHNL